MNRSLMNHLRKVLLGLTAGLLFACSGPAQTPAVQEPVAATQEAVVQEAAPVEEATEAVETEEAAPATAEPTAETEAAAGEDEFTTIYGDKLPEDAAPYAMQIYKVPCDIKMNEIAFDFAVNV